MSGLLRFLYKEDDRETSGGSIKSSHKCNLNSASVCKRPKPPKLSTNSALLSKYPELAFPIAFSVKTESLLMPDVNVVCCHNTAGFVGKLQTDNSSLSTKTLFDI